MKRPIRFRASQRAALTITACVSVGLLGGGAARAQYPATYQVSLNTAPLASELAANSGYQYQLDFALISADTQRSTTTTTLSSFYLGASGSASGTPTTTGGASGNVNSSVTLTNSQFVNELVQNYRPSDLLTFNLSLNASNFQGSNDQLSFFILRSVNNGQTFQAIPTNDPFGANALFSIDLEAAGPNISRFSATNPAFGPPVFTPTPAPPGLVVAGIGLLTQGIRVRRRARRA